MRGQIPDERGGEQRDRAPVHVQVRNQQGALEQPSVAFSSLMLTEATLYSSRRRLTLNVNLNHHLYTDSNANANVVGVDPHLQGC